MSRFAAQMDSRTTAMLGLAVMCVVSPLDISQLVMLIVGAAAYALLQPVRVPPARAQAGSTKSAKACTAAAKYVPPALRSGSTHSQGSGLDGCAKTSSASLRPTRSSQHQEPNVAKLAPRASELASCQRQPTIQPVTAPTFEARGWDAQVEELVGQLLPTAAGNRSVERLALRVKRTLRNILPEAEVVAFASSALLRGQAFSVAVPDVDVVVSCRPETLAMRLQAAAVRGTKATLSLDDRQLQKAALRAFTDRLVASGDFKFRRSAFSADEPKVTLLPTGEGAVPIDLAMNSATPLHNAALLVECGRLDPRAQALALFVRRWAKDRGICHIAKGHLSPYAWTLLTIYFLQVGLREEEPILPALEGFAVSSRLAEKPAGLAATSVPKPLAAGKGKSVSSLFMNFVRFYQSSFDLRNEAVSIRTGKRAPPGLALPLHIMLREDGKSTEVGPCIEDPFDQTRNIGTTMNAAGLDRMKQELARAEELFSKNASLTEMLEPWFPDEGPVDA